MRRLLNYEQHHTPVGSMVVRFYHSGDQIRCYVRQTLADETGDKIFPGEGLDPEVALRLAANRLQDHPDQPIYIELSEGIQWNPDWVEDTAT
ncbi:hypothetical protein [Rhizobium setariae]|uniref:hypothetical protein n=1 Tax=Rhizobium setariae TaxID=2801340 RepID=UPI0031BB2202